MASMLIPSSMSTLEITPPVESVANWRSTHGVVDDHAAGRRVDDPHEDANPMALRVVFECQNILPRSPVPDRVEVEMHRAASFDRILGEKVTGLTTVGQQA
jgi:hypothetical protein